MLIMFDDDDNNTNFDTWIENISIASIVELIETCILYVQDKHIQKQSKY